MKFLGITLALVFFAGSRAFVLRDEPYPHLAQLNQELQEYLRNISRVVDEKVELIRKSELGQSVIDKLHNGVYKVSKRLSSLKAKLPAEITQSYDLVIGVPLGVVEKSLNTMRDLYRKMTPATDELAESLYSAVAPYANSILQRVGPYAKSLHSSLVAKAEELNPKLNEKLKQQLEELKIQLAPYTKMLQSKLQDFQVSLESFINQAQEKFNEGADRVNQTLQPYITRILGALQEYTKDFKKWVDTPVFPPTQ
ncbi:apolipoprotein A-I-like [Rhineura floridana]|uniref:apolipoprotein A-I-like n=1 Tax=Rhineura floridana TaxID=261503 RepID=UPI002AC81B4F|nr:apolipoprotein A-I-like [Rhineura floridana]